MQPQIFKDGKWNRDCEKKLFYKYLCYLVSIFGFHWFDSWHQGNGRHGCGVSSSIPDVQTSLRMRGGRSQLSVIICNWDWNKGRTIVHSYWNLPLITSCIYEWKCYWMRYWRHLLHWDTRLLKKVNKQEEEEEKGKKYWNTKMIGLVIERAKYKGWKQNVLKQTRSFQGRDDIYQVPGIYEGGDINHWRWMSKIRGFPIAGDEQHEQEKWHGDTVSGLKACLTFQRECFKGRRRPESSQGGPMVEVSLTEQRLFQMHHQRRLLC